MTNLLIRYIMMSLDFFSALILGLLLICCGMEQTKTRLLKIYVAMASFCELALLLEASSILAALCSDFFLLRNICNYAAIFCGYGLSYFYACYVINLVGMERRLCRITLRALPAVGLGAVGLLILGSFSNLFFTLKTGGITPGRHFAFIFAFDILACLAGIFLIIVYLKSLKVKDVIALFTLPVFIFLSAVLQYTVLNMTYGLFMMAAVSLFIIYLMIQRERTIAQEKQLMDMNIAMMLSQIQPHFLYNSLSSIRRLISKDPETAATAVENFSQYLRQNLEAMNRAEPISFRCELRHVEEYLYLERLRFGDRLQVEYDISFSEFTLPALTLQPIVENAVKHGILKKEEGGCIRIEAHRMEDCAVVTVTDNGVGILPDMDSKGGRMHIGLRNVERRISMQCKGSIQIKSTVGEGTTITMTFPLF